MALPRDTKSPDVPFLQLLKRGSTWGDGPVLLLPGCLLFLVRSVLPDGNLSSGGASSAMFTLILLSTLAPEDICMSQLV